MSDLLRFLDVRFGLHSANDFVTMPGTLGRIQLVGGHEGFVPRAHTELSRNEISSIPGVGYHHLTGPVDLAELAPQIEFKGVDSNTGAAVADWSTKMEQANLLTSLFGAAAPASVGAAPAVETTGHSTTVLVATTNVIADGDVLLFQTSAGPRIRQVVSGGGTVTLTFSESYTGTPTTASTIVRAARWSSDFTAWNHLHGGFRAEGNRFSTDFWGCAPVGMQLSFPEGGKVLFTSNWAPTDGGEINSKVNPATTVPTAGYPIVALNAEMYIAGERKIVRDVSFSMQTGNVARTTTSSANGVLGGVAGDKRGNCQLTFSLYVGDTAREEVAVGAGTVPIGYLLNRDNSSSGSWEPGMISGSRRVFFKVGSAAGRALAIVIPTADIKATYGQADGQGIVQCVATATDSMSLAVL
jgi:hypothetical protein